MALGVDLGRILACGRYFQDDLAYWLFFRPLWDANGTGGFWTSWRVLDQLIETKQLPFGLALRPL